jgi:hypothetical protein
LEQRGGGKNQEDGDAIRRRRPMPILNRVT